MMKPTTQMIHMSLSLVFECYVYISIQVNDVYLFEWTIERSRMMSIVKFDSNRIPTLQSGYQNLRRRRKEMPGP